MSVTILKSYSKNLKLEDETLLDSEQEVDLKVVSPIDGSVSSKNARDEGYRIAREYYSSILSRPFENIVIFTGAGTSMASGGKSMNVLWDEAFPAAKATESKKFFKTINYTVPTDDAGKDLEALLSQAQIATGVLDTSASDEVSKKIKEIKQLIMKNCTISLTGSSQHLEFLNKITSRKLKYSRAKIFTLNYDTLFEQAASKGNFTLINGFSFSLPSHFDGSFFDYDVINRKNSRVHQEENFVAKVFHLYKPHGSIDWERDASGGVTVNARTKDPLMIYPNANKYEYGYDQPFFEMMSRFQQNVRQSNTLLLCVGFSFRDKHFKNVILEAVKVNAGLSLMIAVPDFADKEQLKEFIDLAEKQNNITMVNEKFEDIASHYPFSKEYEQRENN